MLPQWRISTSSVAICIPASISLGSQQVHFATLVTAKHILRLDSGVSLTLIKTFFLHASHKGGGCGAVIITCSLPVCRCLNCKDGSLRLASLSVIGAVRRLGRPGKQRSAAVTRAVAAPVVLCASGAQLMQEAACFFLIFHFTTCCRSSTFFSQFFPPGSRTTDLCGADPPEQRFSTGGVSAPTCFFSLS